MRNLFLAVAAIIVLSAMTGCSGVNRSQPATGTGDYSLNGKPITPPNMVRVENPYSFAVKVEWLDRHIVIPAHESHDILFEGFLTPGSIRVWKTEETGKDGKELTYETERSGPFNAMKVYQIR